ncbi:hypothetical protein Lgra_1733 [Legionella gratiana]|uniref:Uncharacterized protein n=1 Tax=Legionella gratiana TaxID=45066 RepID=A0A378J7W4_9GAMM|nr:hypothetical protein [Legionella gratiana]KTD10767.1 hypothetical protein Lgra_1733 [Legionella gratiana]STX43894.1 Uncharacterised protein [Legionella gratiana]
MPEIVTKHPEIVFKMLKEANVKCGTGENQTILKACPSDKFCSLPTGELCIYGIKDVSQMTQINVFELFRGANTLIPLMGLFIMIFVLGILTGIKISKK